MRDLIKRYFTCPLHGRRLVWCDWLRVYTDGGNPIWRWFPRCYVMGFDPHWALHGLAIYWLGREFNVVVGKDIHGLWS